MSLSEPETLPLKPGFEPMSTGAMLTTAQRGEEKTMVEARSKKRTETLWYGKFKTEL